MSFKDMVAADLHNVFLNLGEFAERRTVEYDGERYEDIPIVLSGLKEKDRRQLVSDHVQGLFLVSSVLHCARDDLGGKQPEKGTRRYRAAGDSSGSSTLRPRSASWVCCGWSWRRLTNERYYQRRQQPCYLWRCYR